MLKFAHYLQTDMLRNLSSWKLLESLGFSREAHLKENAYFWKDNDNNPIWKDTFIYTILNGEKKKSQE